MSILFERSRPTGRVWYKARVQKPWSSRGSTRNLAISLSFASSHFWSGPRTNTLLLAVKILVREHNFGALLQAPSGTTSIAVFGGMESLLLQKGGIIDFHLVGSVRAWYVLHRRRSYSAMASQRICASHSRPQICYALSDVSHFMDCNASKVARLASSEISLNFPFLINSLSKMASDNTTADAPASTYPLIEPKTGITSSNWNGSYFNFNQKPILQWKCWKTIPSC